MKRKYQWEWSYQMWTSQELTWAWSDDGDISVFLFRVPPDTARRALARRRRDQMAELRRMMRTLREWEVR